MTEDGYVVNLLKFACKRIVKSLQAKVTKHGTTVHYCARRTRYRSGRNQPCVKEGLSLDWQVSIRERKTHPLLSPCDFTRFSITAVRTSI